MNEFFDTERVYVEELLCVLEVSSYLGCFVLAVWGVFILNGFVFIEKYSFI